MTEQNVISFDPGLITGMAAGVFSDTEPLKLVAVPAVTYEEIRDEHWIFKDYEIDHVVVEEFILRTDNPFAADLTGVRVEGILDAVYQGNIHWRNRTTKSQVPDSVLKTHGLWKTGADVEWSDGRDVNDAIIHLLGYVAFDLRHVPTLRKYFGGVTNGT